MRIDAVREAEHLGDDGRGGDARKAIGSNWSVVLIHLGVSESKLDLPC